MLHRSNTWVNYYNYSLQQKLLTTMINEKLFIMLFVVYWIIVGFIPCEMAKIVMKLLYCLLHNTTFLFLSGSQVKQNGGKMFFNLAILSKICHVVVIFVLSVESHLEMTTTTTMITLSIHKVWDWGKQKVYAGCCSFCLSLRPGSHQHSFMVWTTHSLLAACPTYHLTG